MKKLKEGFTTGSCAAAAALASCLWRRDGACLDRVEIVVPEGRSYAPEITAHEPYRCGVIKYSGDDPDITGGMEIIAEADVSDSPGPVTFAAGEGVGTVTEPGLKIPVGQAAINPVPRQMIEAAVRRVYPEAAVRVTVSIPGGRETAKKTFNPRLGIEGGLSVLGTSGVVRPMSLEALRDSLYEELKMRAQQGRRDLIFTFGNQGEAALRVTWPEGCYVQVSNEIGFMLDSARELGVEHILLGGHPGKMTKIAAGVMQTHSHTADGRREAIVTHLALMGADTALMQRVYDSVTTDAAAELIEHSAYTGVWDRLAEAARRYCEARVRREIAIDTVIADAAGRILGRSGRSK